MGIKSSEKKQGLDNSFYVIMSLVFMVSLLPAQKVGGYGIIENMANNLGISANMATAKLFITYGLGLAIGKMIVGPLSDRYGRLPIFTIFLNIFSISSLMCALFISPFLFQFFRFVSGLTIASGIIISRTIIIDNSNMTGGTRIFSLVTAISFIVVGLYPFLISAAVEEFQLQWKSFFVLNAIFCSLVSAITFNLLISLKNNKNKNALKYENILNAFKSTLGKSTYRISLSLYLLCTFTESIEEYFMPIILLDHLKQSNDLLNIMQGAATGIIGAISFFANAKLIKSKFNPVSISVVATIIAAIVAVVMSVCFALIHDNHKLLIIYITLYLISLSCILITGINIYMITTQSINKEKIGAGFITSLTVSLWGVSAFVASYILKFINNMSTSEIINIYSAIAVLVCISFITYKNTLKDLIKNC